MTENSADLRVIRTARTLAEIDEGLAAGFWPLIKPVKVCPPFETWIGVYQEPDTGKVRCFSDQRLEPKREGLLKVLPWQAYCASPRDLPFAAYLLPPDLQIGECVWIEDLIEDYPKLTQAGKQRLTAAKARWNGQNFEVRLRFGLNSRYAVFGWPEILEPFDEGLCSN